LDLLRIIPSLDKTGGGPVHGILNITPFLESHNINTTVITLDDPNNSCLKNHSFKTIGLGPTFLKYGYRKGIVSKIRKIAKDFDAVIIHGIWQYHSFATWRALRKLEIPYFVYTHGQLDPFFKNYKLKHLKKMIYWPLTDFRVLRDAKAVFFTTDQEKKLARSYFKLYKANEIVVNYGISKPPSLQEVSCELFFEKYPELKNKKIILFLSRLNYKKGLDILLEAFAYIKSQKDEKYNLVIAGPNSDRLQEKLEEQASKLNISNQIIWTGMLTHDMKWSAFRAADIFCLPTHSENFGIAIVEALACSLPVITTDKVNIFNDIELSGAGFISNDDLEGIKLSFIKWTNLNEIEKIEMRKNAYNLFQEKFDFAKTSHHLINTLKVFLNKK